MIAIDSQPISVVEDPRFISFVKCLEPHYKMPSRKHVIDTVLPTIINGVKAERTKTFHTPEMDVKQYSFTTDIWSTNVSHRSLLSLTAHWVSNSFEKSSTVVHVNALKGSHTGSYICETVNDVLCMDYQQG